MRSIFPCAHLPFVHRLRRRVYSGSFPLKKAWAFVVFVVVKGKGSLDIPDTRPYQVRDLNRIPPSWAESQLCFSSSPGSRSSGAGSTERPPGEGRR